MGKGRAKASPSKQRATSKGHSSASVGLAEANPLQQSVLDSQRTAGNAATTQLIQRKGLPTSSVKLGRGAWSFALPAVQAGGRSVTIQGRMGFTGKVSAAALPKKAAEVKELVTQKGNEELAKAKPEGAGSTVNVNLAGSTMATTVTDQGDKATSVLAELSAPKQTLTLGDITATGTATLETIVEVGPAKNGAPLGEGDAGVLSDLFYGGSWAVLKSGTVGEGKAAKKVTKNVAVAPTADLALAERVISKLGSKHAELMAELGRSTTAKNAPHDPSKEVREVLDSRYAVLRWLEFMRPWFGSDEATAAHFEGIRQVRGQSDLILHEDAAKRLEAVQEKLGKDAYPKSTVGWSFRGELQLGQSQAHKHMHKIGYAVDFDAYNLPHLKDERIHALIRIASGRSHHLELGEYGARRKTIRQMESGDPKLKDADRAAFLDKVGAEVESLAAASETFKHSLDSTGGPAKLEELRKAWRVSQAKVAEAEKNQKTDPDGFAAALEAQKAEKLRIKGELETVLKPWLSKIDAKREELLKKASAGGVDVTTTAPDAKAPDALLKAQKAVTSAKAKLDKGKPLTKTEVKAVTDLAGKLGQGIPEVPDAAFVQGLMDAATLQVTGMKNQLVKEKTMKDERSGYDLLSSLRTSLTEDFSFLFGSLSKDKEDMAVSDPSANQLLNRGYFRIAAADAGPDDKRKMITKAFVQEMVQHGMEVGGAWGSADAMHFEVAVGAAPAAAAAKSAG